MFQPEQRARTPIAKEVKEEAEKKPAVVPPPAPERDLAVQKVQDGINAAVEDLRKAMKEIKGTPITSSWESWGAKLTEPFRDKKITDVDQLVKQVERVFRQMDENLQGKLKLAEMHGTKDYWMKYRFKPELAKPLSEEEYLRLDGDSRVHYQTHQLLNKVAEALTSLKPGDKSFETKVKILRERWELSTPAAQMEWGTEVQKHPMKP